MMLSRLCLGLALLPFALSSLAAEPVQLEEVASFPNRQVTGISVSKAGRVFVNFPFWADGHDLSVAELKGGQPVPFPNEDWNRSEGDPAQRFVCVQSVVVDDHDQLWVLDAAAPKMESIVKGGPKLVKIDLATNKVTDTILFDETIAPAHSYLNDVRFDTKTQHAFVTESGLGAIIVVDLQSKKARRLLAKHPSTHAEPGTQLVVDGIRLFDPKTGAAPAINSDGLSLDGRSGWLYYRALTGHTVYKVKTADLLDETLSDPELGGRVVKAGETAATDGMIESPSGRIYCAAFEKNALVRLDPATQNVETVIEDKQLQWPDTLSWSPDGSLYVTCSQIHRMPKFNQGVSKQEGPFRVFRVTGIAEGP